MTHRLKILYILTTSLVLCSCAAKKELQTVSMERDELRARNADLMKNVNNLQKEKSEIKNEISTISSRSESLTDEFNQYKIACMEVKERYDRAQGVLDEQADILHQVETKLEEAMADFASKGVEVHYNKGFVFVSMSDNLLYRSGSYSLQSNGKKALSNLATVLNEYPNLKVIVLGNTDDVPYRKSDNWTLSTERANGVVRVLRDLYKVDPSRLTAAGKGKYNPLGDNQTEEGRAKNRRTDIILNPDLDRLWDMIDR